MALGKRLLYIFSFIIFLLLIPFIAMQFSDQVNWTASDFLIMGFLLLGFGLLIDLVLRKVKTKSSRAYLVIGIVVLFLLVWAELAVGIFGTPLVVVRPKITFCILKLNEIPFHLYLPKGKAPLDMGSCSICCYLFRPVPWTTPGKII